MCGRMDAVRSALYRCEDSFAPRSLAEIGGCCFDELQLGNRYIDR